MESDPGALCLSMIPNDLFARAYDSRSKKTTQTMLEEDSRDSLDNPQSRNTTFIYNHKMKTNFGLHYEADTMWCATLLDRNVTQF